MSAKKKFSVNKINYKMSVNDYENNQMETEFNKLNISDRDSDVKKNCLHCDKSFTEELWCKECDPFRIVEGWTSGNPDIDKFIKDTIYIRISTCPNRKSTRLNSSHSQISYAVFCLKKKTI